MALALKGRAFLSEQRLVLLVHSLSLSSRSSQCLGQRSEKELRIPETQGGKFEIPAKTKNDRRQRSVAGHAAHATEARRAERASERRAERSDEQHAPILRTDEGPKEPPPGLAINFR